MAIPLDQHLSKRMVQVNQSHFSGTRRERHLKMVLAPLGRCHSGVWWKANECGICIT